MTTTLPPPTVYGSKLIDPGGIYGNLYTVEQMQAHRAAALEDAALACDRQHDLARTSPGAARADACARAIRALSNT